MSSMVGSVFAPKDGSKVDAAALHQLVIRLRAQLVHNFGNTMLGRNEQQDIVILIQTAEIPQDYAVLMLTHEGTLLVTHDSTPHGKLIPLLEAVGLMLKK